MALSQFRSFLRLLVILVILAGAAQPQPARAQGDPVADLIALVNELRASRGLAPYSVDPELMALAQEHSAYQAAIHTSTHEHSDGRVPPQIGVVENVAGGDVGYLEAHATVYEIWADAGHMRTMVGYKAGAMGVGYADDGVTAYYTLEVRPAEQAATRPASPGAGTAPAPGPSGGGTAAAPLTPIPLAPLVTTTPLPDGSIYHVVGYGQTLWSIALAYGVRVEQLRAWNNLAEDSNEIYAGQKLLVRPLSLVTALPAVSPTVLSSPNSTVAAEGMPTGSSAAPTPMGADGLELTPSLPADPPAALSSPPVGTPPSPGGAPGDPGPLLPLVAAGSILVGSVLLILLRINRKRY